MSSFRDVDIAFRALHGEDHPFPSVRIFSWWNDPDFLQYSAARIQGTLAKVLATGPKRVVVLFSAHGLPRKYQVRGDPYVTETAAHFAALRRRGEAWLEGQVGTPAVEWRLSFQSRVGPVEWVRPYTDEAIQELAKEGGTLLMVPISFTSDHIETLYEMDVTYKELALKAGFADYARVAAPNDDEAFTDCLEKIVLRAGFL